MKQLFKKLNVAISVSYAVLIVYSCGEDITSTRDHLVFRYNEHGNISSLDPAFARNPQNIWPTNQLFNGLVQLDDSLNIQPDIAKYWEVNDSTATYTFYLKDNVYFHTSKAFGEDSTRTVIASDFKYSFDRLIDDEVASPGSWVLSAVDYYEAPNDTTFVVQLKNHSLHF